MTKLPKPSSWSAHYDLTYDAWNRLVKVAEGGATVAELEYDGRNFRTVKKSYSGGQLAETRHFYYNAGWQVLEERVGASTTANRQYVWGVRYMDDLLLRDRDVAAGGDLGVTGSGLDERFYAMQDPNWNVLAIANVSGTVQERVPLHGLRHADVPHRRLRQPREHELRLGRPLHRPTTRRRNRPLSVSQPILPRGIGEVRQ